MRIAIGSDHAGYELKDQVIEYLKKKNYEVNNLGTNSADSVDYPDFGIAVAKEVSENRADLGIVICGSGIGISIAANKVKGIRCALLYDDEVAKLAHEHNNANVIAFGARFMKLEDVIRRIDIFIAASFAKDRHSRRVDKITKYEGR